MTERATQDRKRTPDGVHIRAPAKVNLVLRVLDRRVDGFHNLWSLMQTVALEDEVCIHLRSGSQGIRVECNDPTLPTDHRNLVVRAASLVLRAANSSFGLDISITKRIPMGAGLGGGSSDAAATIISLSHVLGLEWSPEDMARLGQTLGSDVPFFFSAPSAVVRGRGEEVKRLRVEGQRWVVLVQPGFMVETRWAYERLTSTRQAVRPLSQACEQIATKASTSWEDIIPLMENDFEEALAPVHRAFGEIKQELLTRGAEAALLSGSGSTVFGLFRAKAEADKARAAFGSSEEYHASVAATGKTPLTCHERSPGTALLTS